jgi:hypothetical protein
MNTAELLDKAKSRLITRKEIADVARELASEETDADRYTLIHILGAAGATEHEPLVARFLDSPEDPMLARIALQTLISRWGKGQVYRDRMESFVRGVEWDADSDVRNVAISAAGEFLREREDRGLLRLLIDIFTSPSEAELVRQSAYFALGRASGKSWEQLPRASRRMDFDRDVDAGVLTWALDRMK